MNIACYMSRNRTSALKKQCGVSLFITLIALVVIMLAIVALVRSVDTATLISGNLAFKQAATSSGDSGVEKAMTWLNTTSTADAALDPFSSTDYKLNNDHADKGYYYSITNNLDFSANTTWTNAVNTGTDTSGNEVRYIIERMCSYPVGSDLEDIKNHFLGEKYCLFSDAQSDTGTHKTGDPTPTASGKHPLYRITVRTTGPRGTISYIQTFVY